MNNPRETIFAALFALLEPLQASPPTVSQPFVTVSRRLVPWTDCPAEIQPAVYQWQDDQDADQKQSWGETEWVCRAKWFIYVTNPDDSAPSSPAMNALLDAVDNVLGTMPPGQTQTLGGLVNNCYIDGKVVFAENVLAQQSVIVVPITIVTGI